MIVIGPRKQPAGFKDRSSLDHQRCRFNGDDSGLPLREPDSDTTEGNPQVGVEKWKRSITATQSQQDQG